MSEDDENHDLDIEEAFSKRVERLDEESETYRIRDKEDNALKVMETVFDNKTRLLLMSLRNKGYFDEVGGAISTGKEANVYYAPARPYARAIKIFRIDAPSFKKMRPYIEGDHRFRRFRTTRSGFIEAWTKKEFKNLQRLREHGIPAPEPIAVERNILVMEYLGTEEAVLPRLKDIEVSKPGTLYKSLMNSVRDMYQKAQLVHADLSEFNVLVNIQTEEYFIIDVSQSILWSHPRAEEFLLRDLQNLNRYFSLYGIEIIDLRTLYKWITEEDANEVVLSEVVNK